MSKNTFYIGVDVGQDELWTAVDNKKPRCFQNNNSGFKKLWTWANNLANTSELHFCMESTGVYGYNLARHLYSQENTIVSVINPAKISSFSKAQLRRTKTDRVDAQVILDFAKAQNPQAWAPEPQVLRTLYHLVVQLDNLKTSKRQWLNRGSSNSHLPDIPPEVIKSQKSLLKAFEKQICSIETEIKRLYNESEYIKNRVDIICSMNGLGQLSAVRLLAYGKSALTSLKQKSLIAHAGLAPSERQSGKSIKGKSHIAKQGDRRLRKSLYMPALVAIQHNPIIKQFYKRLIERGKPKKLALVACMKKILIIIRSMLINQKTFDPNFNTLT